MVIAWAIEGYADSSGLPCCDGGSDLRAFLEGFAQIAQRLAATVCQGIFCGFEAFSGDTHHWLGGEAVAGEGDGRGIVAAGGLVVEVLTTGQQECTGCGKVFQSKFLFGFAQYKAVVEQAKRDSAVP